MAAEEAAGASDEQPFHTLNQGRTGRVQKGCSFQWPLKAECRIVPADSTREV